MKTNCYHGQSGGHLKWGGAVSWDVKAAVKGKSMDYLFTRK